MQFKVDRGFVVVNFKDLLKEIKTSYSAKTLIQRFKLPPECVWVDVTGKLVVSVEGVCMMVDLFKNKLSFRTEKVADQMIQFEHEFLSSVPVPEPIPEPEPEPEVIDAEVAEVIRPETNTDLVPTNGFSIADTRMYGSQSISIYADQQPLMTREQIGTALGYKNPRNSVQKIHHRKKLDQFSVTIPTLSKDGKVREIIGYSMIGVIEICSASSKKRAPMFRRWITQAMLEIQVELVKREMTQKNQNFDIMSIMDKVYMLGKESEQKNQIIKEKDDEIQRLKDQNRALYIHSKIYQDSLPKNRVY